MHRHSDRALRAARVVPDEVPVAHVGDAILEQDKDLGAMIGTQTIAGAEVLIDPNFHTAYLLALLGIIAPSLQIATSDFMERPWKRIPDAG